MIKAAGVLQTIAGMLNRLLALDPDFHPKLEPLKHKLFHIRVSGLEANIYFTIENNQLCILPKTDSDADVIIQGPPLGLIKLMSEGYSAAALQNNGIEVHGDIQLAQRLGKILSSLNIDWEEILSRYIGDIAAYRIASWARGMNKWQQESLESLANAAGEYLQEEARHTPSRIEVENFMNAVDTLREASDRLEARIARLEQNNRPKQTEKQ